MQISSTLSMTKISLVVRAPCSELGPNMLKKCVLYKVFKRHRELDSPFNIIVWCDVFADLLK